MNNMDIQQLDNHGARQRKGWRDHLRNLGQFFSSRGGDRQSHEESAGRARPQEKTLRDETRQPRSERASSANGKGKSERIVTQAPTGRAARQSHEETLAILEGAPRLEDGRGPEGISPKLIAEWRRRVLPATSMSSMEPLSDMSTSDKSPRLERISKDSMGQRDTVSNAGSPAWDEPQKSAEVNESRWSHSTRSSASSFASDRSLLQGDSDLDRWSIDTTVTDLESAVSSPEVVYSGAEIVTVHTTTVVHAKPVIIDVARKRNEPVEAKRDSSKEREPRSPLEKHERTSELYDHRPPVRGR